jgi:hypothetical protein
MTVRVFDPAMCCSSGVCGPSVEPHLARFAADLKWLESQGVEVQRFNLAQQPAAFAGDQSVRAALETNGEASLPILQVNGETKSSGVYPTRAELAAWAGLGKPTARRAIQLTAVEDAAALRTRPRYDCAPVDGHPGSKSSCC